MTKIQRVKAYRYKDHDIYKFKLNIPSNVLEKLGWDENTEVEIKATAKALDTTLPDDPTVIGQEGIVQ